MNAKSQCDRSSLTIYNMQSERGAQCQPLSKRSRSTPPRRELFRLTQDYDHRLDWDPFLKEARLVGGAQTAGIGVRAWCVAKSGLGMETEYVSFNPPKTVAVKMTKGPAIIGLVRRLVALPGAGARPHAGDLPLPHGRRAALAAVSRSTRSCAWCSRTMSRSGSPRSSARSRRPTCCSGWKRSIPNIIELMHSPLEPSSSLRRSCGSYISCASFSPWRAEKDAQKKRSTALPKAKDRIA